MEQRSTGERLFVRWATMWHQVVDTREMYTWCGRSVPPDADRQKDHPGSYYNFCERCRRRGVSADE